MAKTNKTKRRTKPSNRFHGRVVHEDARACDWPDCTQAGEFRAPKTRARRSDEPPQWYWYCLEHVRQHNEAWNYFEGLSADDIAKMRAGHPSWDNKTFPFQMNPDDLASLKMRDTHGVFSGNARFSRFAEGRGADGKPLTAEKARALAVLGLDESASTQDIKHRYKRLLKTYHPDSNGGDRSGEKKMQAVLAAYHQLMDA